MKTTNWLPSLTACCILAALTTSAATLYVWTNSASPASPYTNWATAAHTIQEAVDAASAGDTVLVTNGVYITGGKAVYGVMTNRVAVDKPIMLQSVNGPQVTIIEGAQAPGGGKGDGAIRCVYLTNGAMLSGFTLTNGATRTAGDFSLEGSGGGLWCETTNAAVSNCLLTGDSANFYGGGAYMGTLNDCTLTGNSAYDGGGAAGATLNNCTLTGNSGEMGGGAWESTLNNCTLTGDSAGWGGGGAYGGTLNNCTLTGNSATYGGGAYGGTLNTCTLSGNSTSLTGGGAEESTLDNCTLIANSANEDGGGAYGGRLNNCTLTGNSSTLSGGGAMWSTLSNCTLTGNSAGDSGGGASVCTLNNCTLTGNSATGRNGASGGASSCTLNNSIVYYNTAANSPNCDGTLNFCCATPLPPNGTGNITADPLLASASHLSDSSPCRGAGSVAYATGTDIDGEPWGNPPSIGCDEFGPGAATGPLSVVPTTTSTNVATLFMVRLVALIEGRATASVWDFGGGVVVSNQPYTSHAWAVPGDYGVVLRVYNDSHPQGVSATQMVHVVAQPVHYVAADSITPTPPYTNWANAAHTIQDAVDAATVAAALVLVSNGVYAVGGRAVSGTLTNRVAVDRPLTISSVNGPEFTVIQGYQVPGTTNGDGAIRCVYLTNGAMLSGFTLANGATRAAGDWPTYRESSGGGLWCESANATVSNCTFTANSANQDGGGAYGGTLNNCTLTRNSASQVGGGASECTLDNCTLTANSASSGGGSYGGTLNNCTLTGNSAYDGGGVCGGRLNHCNLSGNSANFGGGAEGGWLNDCNLRDNSASIEGGGGYYFTVLSNCTVVGNWASYGGGASQGTLSNCLLRDNSAAGNGGGAEESTLENCALTGNWAGGGGGAVYGGTLNNCTLRGNSTGWDGGGAGSATLHNCTLSGNLAERDGGGAAESTLYRCALMGNSASLGGGAYMGTLYNCTLTGNAANAGGGAAGSAEKFTLVPCTLCNCTLTGNVAFYACGGAYVSRLNNCIVYYNTAPNEANYPQVEYGNVLNFCCTTPLPTYGVGNITNEPAFVNPAAGDLRLRYGSPCIDAGTNLSDIITDDLDGNPRPIDGDGDRTAAFDMGAYEFNPATLPPTNWLTAHGLDAASPKALYEDPDLDGLMTLYEWEADTDPANPASCLRLTIISDTTAAVVAFSSSPARLYTLLCCTNVTSSSVWTPVPGQTDMPGTGDVLTLTDAHPSPAAFYRVSVRLP